MECESGVLAQVNFFRQLNLIVSFDVQEFTALIFFFFYKQMSGLKPLIITVSLREHLSVHKHAHTRTHTMDVHDLGSLSSSEITGTPAQCKPFCL